MHSCYYFCSFQNNVRVQASPTEASLNQLDLLAGAWHVKRNTCTLACCSFQTCVVRAPMKRASISFNFSRVCCNETISDILLHCNPVPCRLAMTIMFSYNLPSPNRAANNIFSCRVKSLFRISSSYDPLSPISFHTLLQLSYFTVFSLRPETTTASLMFLRLFFFFLSLFQSTHIHLII